MKARAIASLMSLAMVLALNAAHASGASSLYRFDFKTHGYVVTAIGERATVVIGSAAMNTRGTAVQKPTISPVALRPAV